LGRPKFPALVATYNFVAVVYFSWLAVWWFTSDRRVYDSDFDTVPQSCRDIVGVNIVNATQVSQLEDCFAFCEVHSLGHPLSVFPAISFVSDSAGAHRMCMKARLWINTPWIRSPPVRIGIAALYLSIGFVIAWRNLAWSMQREQGGYMVMMGALPQPPKADLFAIVRAGIERLGLVSFAQFALDLIKTVLDNFTDMYTLMVFLGNGQHIFAFGMAVALWMHIYDDPFQAEIFQEAYISLRQGKRTHALNEQVSDEGRFEAPASAFFAMVALLHIEPSAPGAFMAALNLVITLVSSVRFGMDPGAASHLVWELKDFNEQEEDDKMKDAVPLIIRYYTPVVLTSLVLPIAAGLHNQSPALLLAAALTLGLSVYFQRSRWELEAALVWVPMVLCVTFEVVIRLQVGQTWADAALIRLLVELKGQGMSLEGRAVAAVQLLLLCASILAWLLLVLSWTPARRWAEKDWYIAFFSERARRAQFEAGRLVAAGNSMLSQSMG